MQRAKIVIDFSDGSLAGHEVIQTTRKVSQLAGFFENEAALKQMDGETVIYQVQAYFPVAQGLEGGLFFGKTTLFPGKVGDEYFMTKGHFHEKIDRGEFYWGIKGHGVLLLMDENRKAWAEKMSPGSLHYIPGRVAHRTINTGKEPLHFGACWPSDAGYNYDEILENGFSARIKEVDGQAEFLD